LSAVVFLVVFVVQITSNRYEACSPRPSHVYGMLREDAGLDRGRNSEKKLATDSRRRLVLRLGKGSVHAVRRTCCNQRSSGCDVGKSTTGRIGTMLRTLLTKAFVKVKDYRKGHSISNCMIARHWKSGMGSLTSQHLNVCSGMGSTERQSATGLGGCDAAAGQHANLLDTRNFLGEWYQGEIVWWFR